MRRNIVRIDEAKCNGCGQCVEACQEGAIQIIDGKARLVSESYCDGLGACLGECPQDAITIEQRQAEPFDEQAVREQKTRRAKAAPLACGCPGSMARRLAPAAQAAPPGDLAYRQAGAPAESRLGNWPVQLALVPPNAPYLRDADLLIAADCVGFALPDLHRRLLGGKVLLIACPKLDDAEPAVEKLAALFAAGTIRSVTVAHMEVPCCRALERIVRTAMDRAGAEIPLECVEIGIAGDVRSPAGAGRPSVAATETNP